MQMRHPALAIDCTDKVSSVAIQNGSQLWQVEEQGARGQARKIFSLIDQCLQQAQLEKNQLCSICWAAGPGSFTGLRVATAVAQGLSYALNLPLVGVSSLEAQAVAASRLYPDSYGPVAVITNAHMGEYYWAIFELVPGERPIRLSPDMLSEETQISTDQRVRLVIGNSAEKMPLPASAEIVRIEETLLRAQDLFAVAAPAFAAGKGISARQAEPIYLRNKSAWKTLDQQSAKEQK